MAARVGDACRQRDRGSVRTGDRASHVAKVIDADRVRFEIHGGQYRLIAAFHFRRQIAFVKFIGTHAEYDRIDARTVPQF